LENKKEINLLFDIKINELDKKYEFNEILEIINNILFEIFLIKIYRNPQKLDLFYLCKLYSWNDILITYRNKDIISKIKEEEENIKMSEIENLGPDFYGLDIF
jgi:hypothetical protein